MSTTKSKILFKEEQKQKTPWIWLVIFPIICLYLYFLFNKRSDTNIFEGDDFASYIILCAVFFMMMIGLTLLFYKMKLTLNIRSDGVYIKFSPRIKKVLYISKTEIARYELIEFNRMSKMKSYKLKSKYRQTGKAYTISGDYGLVIFLINEKKVLIDTNRKEAVKSAMNRMMNQE